MNLRVVLYMVSILFAPGAQLFSFVYEIQVMRFWNKNHGDYQYVIVCSDFHDARSDALLNQRSTLLSLFERSSVDTVSITLEDLHSPNMFGAQRCAGYRLSSSHGLLSGLTLECKALGFDVANIEYRYARAISLGGISGASCHYRPAHDIYVKSLLDEIVKAVHEVKRYSDGATLNKYYQNVCDRVMSHRLFRNLKKERITSVSDFYERSTIPNDCNFLKELLTFDSPLLDCKLIHQIVNNARSRVLVVIAGGVHSGHVCEVLSRVGYELIEKVSNADSFPTNNVIAAQIACGSFFSRKPRPVSLYLLKKYLHK